MWLHLRAPQNIQGKQIYIPFGTKQIPHAHAKLNLDKFWVVKKFEKNSIQPRKKSS
jgi:hypothetical protein